jgi:hypothetical protein
MHWYKDLPTFRVIGVEDQYSCGTKPEGIHVFLCLLHISRTGVFSYLKLGLEKSIKG